MLAATMARAHDRGISGKPSVKADRQRLILLIRYQSGWWLRIELAGSLEIRRYLLFFEKARLNVRRLFHSAKRFNRTAGCEQIADQTALDPIDGP